MWLCQADRSLTRASAWTSCEPTVAALSRPTRARGSIYSGQTRGASSSTSLGLSEVALAAESLSCESSLSLFYRKQLVLLKSADLPVHRSALPSTHLGSASFACEVRFA